MSRLQKFQQLLDPQIILFNHKLNTQIKLSQPIDVVDGIIVIKQQKLSITRMNNIFKNLQQEPDNQDLQSYSQLQQFQKMNYNNIYPDQFQNYPLQGLQSYDEDFYSKQEGKEDKVQVEQNEQDEDSWQTVQQQQVQYIEQVEQKEQNIK